VNKSIRIETDEVKDNKSCENLKMNEGRNKKQKINDPTGMLDAVTHMRHTKYY